jgi:hypothetical protein
LNELERALFSSVGTATVELVLLIADGIVYEFLAAPTATLAELLPPEIDQLF